MCFGRAIWLGRSLSRNTLQCYCSAIAYHCGFAAYRKPPLVNILPSDYPIHQTVLVQKRRNSCDTRAHCLGCIVCSHDDAVLVQAELLVPVWCCGNCAKLCARELHKLVRRHARAVRTAVVRFGRRMYSAIVRAARRCVVRLIHQHRWAHPLPIVVTYALVVAEPCAWAGARRVARCTARLRFKLRGQSAPPCAHCCVRMRIRCTRLSIPVATRMYS